MDSLQIIRHFFSRMRCHFCSTHFAPEGIELVQEEGDVFLVNVSCSHCEREAGLAMVSLDKDSLGRKGMDKATLDGDDAELLGANFEHFETTLSDIESALDMAQFKKPRFKDPELTPDERKRLKAFDSITDDDVLDAHHFIQDLDSNWQVKLQQEIARRNTAREMADAES